MAGMQPKVGTPDSPSGTDADADADADTGTGGTSADASDTGGTIPDAPATGGSGSGYDTPDAGSYDQPAYDDASAAQ